MPSRKITVSCSQCKQLRPLLSHLYFEGYLCPTCNREKRKAETRRRNAEKAQEIKAKRRAAIYVDRECPICHTVRSVKKYQDPDCLCHTCSSRKMGKANTLPYKKEHVKVRRKRKVAPKVSKKKKIITKTKKTSLSEQAKAIKAREKLRTRVDVSAPLFRRTSMSRKYTDEESAMINDFIKKRGVSVIAPSLPPLADDQTGNEVFMKEHYF